ncbi:PadR family transcriptional regulator [Leuconostoc pseudomesenteroides]|uniref:PadR family transcriptional regulator n=1 Tax=Leuconostoc pseudomesenteroides TaxID=33968 RepID=UPI00301CEBE4
MIPLLILGILLEIGESSPYIVLSTIKKRNYKYLVHVTTGSLYYNFKQLEKSKYLKLTRIEKSDSYPDQSFYQVTDQGNQHFTELMDKYSNSHEDIKFSFYLPTLFIDKFTQSDFEKSLRNQIEFSEMKIKEINDSLSKNSDNIPFSSKIMMQNAREHYKINIEMFTDLLSKK